MLAFSRLVRPNPYAALRPGWLVTLGTKQTPSKFQPRPSEVTVGHGVGAVRTADHGLAWPAGFRRNNRRGAMMSDEEYRPPVPAPSFSADNLTTLAG